MWQAYLFARLFVRGGALGEHALPFTGVAVHFPLPAKDGVKKTGYAQSGAESTLYLLRYDALGEHALPFTSTLLSAVIRCQMIRVGVFRIR